MIDLCICYNPLPISKHKLARWFFTKSNNLTPISAALQAYTPISTPILGPLDIYTNVYLQKSIKLALKSFI